MMKSVTIAILIFIPFVTMAQNDRKIIREGVKEYKAGEYTDAEIRFRNALEIDSTSLPANYNVAGSLYKQEKYDEASEIYNSLTENINSSDQLADTWHNAGNSLLQKQDYEKAIESYKNSLRLRPSDQDTKYNLAYAQSMLKKQQEQENKDDQDKKDENDEKKDEQDKDKKEDENKDQENNKDQQDQENKDDEQEKQKPEPSKEGISKEEMERMLQAVQQQEKNVLDKVEKEKAKAAKVRTDKDW